MVWKSASLNDINNIKFRKRYIYFIGVILSIGPMLIAGITHPSKSEFFSILVVFILVSVCLLNYAFHIVKYRFHEVTNEYIAFNISYLWTSYIFRFYYDEIESINVSYISYSVNFNFIMKYGETNILVWGFGNVYKWLFPVLDKIYNY